MHNAKGISKQNMERWCNNDRKTVHKLHGIAGGSTDNYLLPGNNPARHRKMHSRIAHRWPKKIHRKREKRMTTTLYELDFNLRQIDSLLSACQDEETMEILDEAKKVLLQDMDEKMVDIITYMQDCQAKIDRFKQEIERLTKKSQAINKRKEFLKKLIIEHMQATKQNKAEYGTFDVTLAKTPDKLVVNESESVLFPQHLMVTHQFPDKAAIKAMMKAQGKDKLTVEIDGKEIELAHLETSSTIRIK